MGEYGRKDSGLQAGGGRVHLPVNGFSSEDFIWLSSQLGGTCSNKDQVFLTCRSVTSWPQRLSGHVPLPKRKWSNIVHLETQQLLDPVIVCQNETDVKHSASDAANPAYARRLVWYDCASALIGLIMVQRRLFIIGASDEISDRTCSLT